MISSRTSRRPGTDQLEGAGRGVREVDDAAVDEGAAIGDADVHSLLIVEIYYMHPGIEGQSAMGGGHLLHVVDFAIGGDAAVVRMTVPAGDSRLDEERRGRRGIRGSWARAVAYSSAGR